METRSYWDDICKVLKEIKLSVENSISSKTILKKKSTKQNKDNSKQILRDSLVAGQPHAKTKTKMKKKT